MRCRLFTSGEVLWRAFIALIGRWIRSRAPDGLTQELCCRIATRDGRDHLTATATATTPGQHEAPLLEPGEAPHATGRVPRLLVPDVDALGRAIIQRGFDVLALPGRRRALEV